jgi:hypothetical protein
MILWLESFIFLASLLIAIINELFLLFYHILIKVKLNFILVYLFLII